MYLVSYLAIWLAIDLCSYLPTCTNVHVTGLHTYIFVYTDVDIDIDTDTRVLVSCCVSKFGIFQSAYVYGCSA